MDYRMGDAVEVVDGESSWSAKVLEIKDGSALVHFLKFNARHDEWIPLERIKRKGELPASSCDQKEFKVGERVMAPWKYGRKYPGVVMERESRGYKVKFYDGVTVSVKPSTMRYLRKDEIPSDDEEGEEEDEDEEQQEDDQEDQEEEEESVTPSSGRRERKSKFNIKDLLSVRPRRPQKTSTGSQDESGEDDESIDAEESLEQLTEGKNKSVAKKGAKDVEELRTSTKNQNHHHSRLSKGSDSQKPQKKASSSGETLSEANSAATTASANSSKNSVNKLSKKSFRLSSSCSSVNKSSKSDKKHQSSESSSKKQTSKKDSSSRKSSSSKGKEETVPSSSSKDSSRKPSRKSETSLKSSKSLDNQAKEERETVSSSNKVKKSSHRKTEDKGSSKSSSPTSSSKRLSDPEKENSRRTQLKRSALISSKDPLHKSSPQGTKNEIRSSLKEETETKKNVKRDEMPASECLSHDESEEISCSSVSDPKKLCNSECDRNGKSEESNEVPLEKKENIGNDTAKESDKSSDPKKKTSVNNNSSVSEPSSKKEESSSSAKSAKVNGGTLKPRITEPLLKEGPPIALVTGKRERKRKKFWDEEEDPPAFAPPPKSTKRSGDLSARRSSSSASSNTQVNSHEPEPVVKTVTKSASKAAKIKFKTEADVRAGNGKKLEYLLFDMNQDPKLIAKQMIEGYNIPGPGVPIPVDSSSLPDGWEKRVIQRGLGVTRGKWDVFIQNAAGKSFRSKTELQKHFDENNLNYSIDSFDFSLDDNLKRLRQIWKQYVIKPNLKPGEKFSSPVPAKYNRKSSSAKHPKDSSVLSSLNTNLPSYLPRVQSSSSSSAGKIKDNGSDTPNVKNRIPSPLGLETLDSSPGIVSETGQGLRCKINKCGKLFRNDKLLLMHVKHYHPEFRDSFPPVSCVPPGDGIEDDEGILGGKRKSESSSLTVSAPPEKKLKTLLPEVDRRKVVSSNHESTDLSTGRKRNDGCLSVGSGCTTDGERAASPTTPAKIFKSNQRKQFQLGSRKCTFLTTEGEDGKGQDDSNSEMDASTTSADHLTSEEVVNCTCRRLEEDGLMIQCDLCLCWQHGSCLGIFDEEQVPEKHVCSICKDPPGRRHAASRTQIDQDLLKEGKLICIPSSSSSSTSLHSAKQDAFRKLSDLMADLIGLSKILHSLRIKISVASQKNSSKVFMWSSPWISPHQPPKPEKEECGSTSEALDIVDNNEEVVPPLVESAEGELNGFKEADLGDSIDPSMIPSVSEVQELLPSIIEAEGLLQGSQEVDGDESFTPEPPPPIMPTFIPEPKRIDKDESRNNLIQHIDDVQCEVEERLNILEENLVRLEKDDKYSQLTIYDALNADCAKTKAIIQMLLLDLSTGKTMLGTI